ncbi:hypothetical protein D3C83_162200 [compost metagenome]
MKLIKNNIMAEEAKSSGVSMFIMALIFIAVLFFIWLIYNQFNKKTEIDIDVKAPSGHMLFDENNYKIDINNLNWKIAS